MEDFALKPFEKMESFGWESKNIGFFLAVPFFTLMFCPRSTGRTNYSGKRNLCRKHLKGRLAAVDLAVERGSRVLRVSRPSGPRSLF